MKEDDKNEGEKYREVVGKIIKKYREAREMSQEDLAAESKVSVTTISEIENFKANFSAETIASLIGPLKIDLAGALSILLKSNRPEKNE